MVKVTTHEQSEDKKDTTAKKKATAKKKPVATGIWPCKINGCNKQFAREADLKRHQRTTKLHSMPGFACPQCEATFTRTDALRRHQKSRHNGIVIEPTEQEKNGDEQAQSDSSSSAGPSSKGKDASPATFQGRQITNGPPTGHSSYYRQHTATTSTTNPHYAQVALPTSSARTHSVPTWPPPPSGYHPISGAPVVFYHHSRYYRPNGVAIPPPPQLYPQQPISNGSGTQSSSRPATPRHDTPPTTADSSDTLMDVAIMHDSDEPQHSLSISHELKLKEVLSMESTRAAMEAVLKSASVDNDSRWSGSPMGGDGEDPEEDNIEMHLLNGGHSPIEHSIHGYGRQLERPEPMEHMLTEDGEPMLNPAELLTQESLASPPPS